MSLLLVPASRENLEKSIEQSVDLSFAERYLPNSFIKEILKHSGLEGIRCWAMTKNKRAIFNRIQNGDEVLLTERGTGKFTHYGIVVGKIQNVEFGNALWPVVGESPWECIYFLANIKKVQYDKSSVVTELGYDSNFAVPGVIIAKEHNYNQIGTISKHFEIPVSDHVAEVNPQRDFSDEDVPIRGKRRRSHKKFSADVKKRYDGKCAICGIKETEFLVAGHISRWSDDIVNRLNPQNGICFCTFHDKAFEHGYIGINESFEVVLNAKIDRSSPLYILLLPINGAKMALPQEYPPDQQLLKKHREEHKLGEYGN